MANSLMANIHLRGNQETMGSGASKLRNYESRVQGLMQTHISAVETLVESLKDNNKKLRERCLPVAPVQIRVLEVIVTCSPDRESGYASQTDLRYFLLNNEEDMRWWDQKPTCVLTP